MEFDPESDFVNIEMTVVFPGSEPERKLFVNPENTVKEEKENLLRHINCNDPHCYDLILVGPNRHQVVMNDSQLLDVYTHDLASSSSYYLEIKKKGTATSVQPKPVNTQTMGVALK